MSSWSPLDQNRNAPAPATGDQRTLVMLANFRDAAVSCTADAISHVRRSDRPVGQRIVPSQFLLLQVSEQARRQKPQSTRLTATRRCGGDAASGTANAQKRV
jgi:hypothetical protein